ncbi:MAG: hypothetical protein WA731_05980, partial [Pseudonocardiaceae bacterium]
MTPPLSPTSEPQKGNASGLAAIVAAEVRCVARAVVGWLIPLLGLVLLTAGCTSSSSSGNGPPGAQGQQALPSGCTHTITRADDVQTALDAAAAGDTLCFSGGDLADTDM